MQADRNRRPAVPADRLGEDQSAKARPRTSGAMKLSVTASASGSRVSAPKDRNMLARPIAPRVTWAIGRWVRQRPRRAARRDPDEQRRQREQAAIENQLRRVDAAIAGQLDQRRHQREGDGRAEPKPDSEQRAAAGMGEDGVGHDGRIPARRAHVAQAPPRRFPAPGGFATILREPMHFLANPARFLKIARPLTGWLGWTGAALIAGALIAGLFFAPPDQLQGESVRIIYVHVPAAWLGMAGWAGIAVASLMQIVWRHPLASVAARAIAVPGAVFTAICLATGSLWGRPTWGT